MPIPAYGTIGDILVVPLNNKYNVNFLPLEANGEVPVKEKWFDGGDVQSVPLRPHLETRGVNLENQANQNQINIADFFPVGDSLG